MDLYTMYNAYTRVNVNPCSHQLFLSLFQVGILLLFNLLAMLLVFPAILSIDAWRKKEYRIDVLCCMESAQSSSTRVRDISVLPPPSPPSPYPLVVGEGRDNQITITDLEETSSPPRYKSSSNHSSSQQQNTVALSQPNSECL